MPPDRAPLRATETTCPQCGGPVTIPEGGRQHWSGVPQSLMTQAIPPDYRTTAADPAQVKAMEVTIKVLARLVRDEYGGITDAAFVHGNATDEEMAALAMVAKLLEGAP